ncbi:hypothetical protein [Salipiger mucosus]|uniref:Helix-turn-helix domain-containing protein n=1 Tax=Salipiger mucosus DSM 16094 TaxID=1123237 RepID=S9QR52_9RHOB|nr:hypothetical protein [Salipiger mucosus]EPX82088.1 hypothetical protein Salmuc_02456 [Salipiger mucosus DSM 16094]
MAQLTATELAGALDLSKGRISQLVRAGQLDGCYSGDGRARRFDLEKVAAALGRRLDPGQMLGNGAKTRDALSRIPESGAPAEDDTPPRSGAGATELPAKDPSRYELAKTLKAEEDARTARRRNQEAEETFVLASVVANETARQMAQEIASIESSVLRAGARRIADDLGVDFREARAILTEVWREYRSARSRAKESEAEAAQLTEDEQAEDF